MVVRLFSLWHLLMLALVLVPAAVAGASERLVAAISGQVSAVDPHEARTGADFQYYEHLFDTLLTRDGFGVAGRLAKSWNHQGHRVWSFQIDPTARFSDGRPVTARDVAWSLCRFQVLTERQGREMLGMSRIVADNAGRVSVTLDSPYRHFPAALSLVYIVAAPLGARDGVLGCDPEQVMAGRATPKVGSGPYVPAPGTSPPEQRALVPSPQCWRDCAAWSRVVLWSAPDARDRLRLLVTGQADVMEDVIPIHLPYLNRMKGTTLAELPTDRTLMLTFNLRPKLADGQANPLTDARVRRAIALTVDRHLLVERGLEGFAGPAWQLAQPGMEGYLPERSLTVMPDVEKARSLMAAAGYARGLELRLLMPMTRITDRPRVADALAGMLRGIGITLTVTAVPAVDARARINDGDFQMMFAGLGLTAGSAMEGYAFVAGSAGRDTTANPSGYRNPELDDLLRQGRAAEPRDILALTAKATAILDADLPMLPLMYIRDLVVHRAGLSLQAHDTTRAFGRITTPSSADASAVRDATP